MIGILRLQLFQDLGGLELFDVGLVGGIGRFVEGQRMENCCLGITGIARRQLRHRSLVVCRALLLRDAGIVLVVGGKRLDPGDLPLGFLRGCARSFDSFKAALEDIAGKRADEWIGTLADRDAPIGHGARRLLLGNGAERLHGLRKEEGMLHRHGAIELLLRCRAARDRQTDLAEPLLICARSTLDYQRAERRRDEHVCGPESCHDGLLFDSIA